MALWKLRMNAEGMWNQMWVFYPYTSKKSLGKENRKDYWAAPTGQTSGAHNSQSPLPCPSEALCIWQPQVLPLEDGRAVLRAAVSSSAFTVASACSVKRQWCLKDRRQPEHVMEHKQNGGGDIRSRGIKSGIWHQVCRHSEVREWENLSRTNPSLCFKGFLETAPSFGRQHFQCAGGWR